jgi:predicted dehydrogenase
LLDNAFPYRGQRLRIVKAQDRFETETELQIAHRDHFASEMDYMANCVLQNSRPNTPGEEGLRDQLLMEAIYRSAESRSPVKV